VESQELLVMDQDGATARKSSKLCQRILKDICGSTSV